MEIIKREKNIIELNQEVKSKNALFCTIINKFINKKINIIQLEDKLKEINKFIPKSFYKRTFENQKEILKSLSMQVDIVGLDTNFELINYNKSIITSSFYNYLEWELHKIGIKIPEKFILTVENNSLYCGDDDNPHYILVRAKVDNNNNFVTRNETKIIIRDAFRNNDLIDTLIIGDSIDCRIDFLQFLKLNKLILLTDNECFNSAYLNSLLSEMVIAPRMNINTMMDNIFEFFLI